jgi:hypothetical protein
VIGLRISTAAWTSAAGRDRRSVVRIVRSGRAGSRGVGSAEAAGDSVFGFRDGGGRGIPQAPARPDPIGGNRTMHIDIAVDGNYGSCCALKWRRTRRIKKPNGGAERLGKGRRAAAVEYQPVIRRAGSWSTVFGLGRPFSVWGSTVFGLYYIIKHPYAFLRKAYISQLGKFFELPKTFQDIDDELIGSVGQQFYQLYDMTVFSELLNELYIDRTIVERPCHL